MAWILVKDGIIVNHIEYDGVSPYEPPENQQMFKYDDPFNVGWSWDGTKAVEPVLPLPEPTPQPTLADLQAQLAALTTQIQALANTSANT